mgnify:CR=1 FL=1
MRGRLNEPRRYHHIGFCKAAQELLPKLLDNSAISSIIKKDRSNANRLRPGQWNPGKHTERKRTAETLSLRLPQPPEQPPARSGTHVRRYRAKSGVFTGGSFEMRNLGGTADANWPSSLVWGRGLSFFRSVCLPAKKEKLRSNRQAAGRGKSATRIFSAGERGGRPCSRKTPNGASKSSEAPKIQAPRRPRSSKDPGAYKQ